MMNLKKKCTLCGSQNANIYFRLQEREIVKCKNCGFMFENTGKTLENIRKDYEIDTYKRNWLIDEENIYANMTGMFSTEKDRIEEYLGEKGKLLDLGCARGYFLDFMKKHGWQVQGVDLSSDSAAIAEKEFGIEVFAGELLEANFASESFDVVTMLGLMAHLINPKEILLETNRILKHNGLLVINTQNEGWFLTRPITQIYKLLPGVMMSYMKLMYDDEHINFYSVKTLSVMLRQAGFRVIKVFYDEPLTMKFAASKFPWYIQMLVKMIKSADCVLNTGRKMSVYAQKVENK